MAHDILVPSPLKMPKSNKMGARSGKTFHKERIGMTESFSQVLNDLRLPRKVRDYLDNHQLWSKWVDIVGVELARVTAPCAMKGKALEVKVVHQAWAQQLQFLKPSILAKIRGLCPSVNIKDLLFRVGKVDAPVATPGGRAGLREKSTGPIELSERMEMTLRAVEDDALRKSIRSAMEAAARSKT